MKKMISESRLNLCLDCGKCTAVCPVSRYDARYSPRMLVNDAVRGDESEVLQKESIWACLACGACEVTCQSGVHYSEMIRGLRGGAHELGKAGHPAHGGAMQSLMRIMAGGGMQQDRLGWLPKGAKTAATSDTLFFVGCQPYFDALFADIGVRTLSGSRGAITLLNRLGIVPAILPNERCCGHDMLWSGDIATFRKLAELNVEEIRKTGARRVVLTCPEGFQTLKHEYARYLGDTGLEVVHLLQLVAEAVSAGQLRFRRFATRVTYHDPCRLGRISRIYEEPRTILRAIPGVELVEMKHHRSTALCCGTQAWMNCGAVSKQIQAELLREAKATGAEVLITACPKCQIHLKCAMHDDRLGRELGIEIRDITAVVGRALAE